MEKVINKAKNFIRIAESVSMFSKDEETKVGALLVDPSDGAIVASGYNGFVRGADDSKIPKTRPNKYPYTIHAEVNLIINCANHGISTKDKVLVCTHSPCKNCARIIQNAGIRTVIFTKWYLEPEAIKDLDIDFEYKENDGFVVLKFK